jgi:hypothetical protein
MRAGVRIVFSFRGVILISMKTLSMLFVACLTLVVAVTISQASVSGKSPARKVAEGFCRDGKDFLAEGQEQVALNSLDRAIATDKTYSAPLSEKGAIYMSRGAALKNKKKYTLAKLAYTTSIDCYRRAGKLGDSSAKFRADILERVVAILEAQGY